MRPDLRKLAIASAASQKDKPEETEDERMERMIAEMEEEERERAFQEKKRKEREAWAAKEAEKAAKADEEFKRQEREAEEREEQREREREKEAAGEKTEKGEAAQDARSMFAKLAVVKQEEREDPNRHPKQVGGKPSHTLYPHSNTIQTEKTTPRDMIYHEAVSSLIEEVRQLRQRCESLEEVNAELKSDMRAIERTQADIVAQTLPQCDAVQVHSKANLSGYASSECSNHSETLVFGK